MPQRVQLDLRGTLPLGILRGIVQGRIVEDRAALVARPVGVSTSGTSEAPSRAGK